MKREDRRPGTFAARGALSCGMRRRDCLIGGLAGIVGACGTASSPPAREAHTDGPEPAAPAPASAPAPAEPIAPAIDPVSVSPPIDPVRGTVVLVAFGDFPTELLDAVQAGLEAELQVHVDRMPTQTLPNAAWYPKRRRYRADRLLDHLRTLVADAPATTRALGLTAVDISTTKPPHEDWGIFGLGLMPGQAAVVSSYRLARKAKDQAQIVHRVVNTAIHEIGHTFGLDHCAEPGCPMQDAEGSIANTDSSDGHLRQGCRTAIDRNFPIARPIASG